MGIGLFNHDMTKPGNILTSIAADGAIAVAHVHKTSDRSIICAINNKFCKFDTEGLEQGNHRSSTYVLTNVPYSHGDSAFHQRFNQALAAMLEIPDLCPPLVSFLSEALTDHA
jgi:hypothetical protein